MLLLGFASRVGPVPGDEFLMPSLAPAAEAVRAWLDTVDFEPRLRAYALEQLEHGCPDALGRVATAVMFRRNVLRIAAARAAGGAPAWMYDFQQASAVTGLSGHCLELPFTWNCLADPWAVAQLGPGAPQALADEMHGAWVSFMRAGDPGWAAGTGRVMADLISGKTPEISMDGLTMARYR